MPGTLTVNKATLSASAPNQSREYGEPNPTLSVEVTGFVNGEDLSVLATAPTATTEASTASNVGSYPITVSAGNDDNYDINTSDGTLTITQTNLTATAVDKVKTYGEENPTLEVIYSGFKNEDDKTALTTAPSPSTTATSTSAAGEYPISLSTGSDDNYTISNVPGTLTVNKAILSATAEDATRGYKQENPAFSILYKGFKNSDDQSVIDALPTVITLAKISSNSGDYVLTPKGGEDTDYDFEYISGKLTIEKAHQKITFEPLPANLTTNTSDLELQASTDSGLPISYSSSNETVAIINGSTLLIESSGLSTITASQFGDSNYLPAENVDQLLAVAAVLGIPTIGQKEMSIYPNPAENDLHLLEKIDKPGRLRLTDLNGKVLMDRTFESLERIEIRHLKNGVYLLYIEIENSSLMTKFVKK